MPRRTRPAYRFNPLGGEYVGTADADESPLEPDIFHLPANATFDAPPAPQPGFARVWNGTAWTQIEDHRGKRAWVKATGEVGAVVGLGPVPAELTLVERPSLQHVWNGTAWAVDPEALAAWLDARRAESARAADAAAEAARQRFVTPGAGMAMVYDAKRREAFGFTLERYDADLFPLIAAEVARRGASPADVAAEWSVLADAWSRVAATIETARLDAKDAIRAAPDGAGIDAALKALEAALDALPAP